MAGQSPSRRQVLQAFSLAAVAAAAPGFSRWCFALDETAQEPGSEGSSGAAYVPRFFTPQEYETVEGLTELILPSELGPGAREAGVAEFIDFMVQNDSSLHEPFRSGLAWLDLATGSRRSFAGLPHVEQTRILDRLAYKKYQRADEKAGQDFFKLARQYTVMGFYTTKIGLEALDFPGLKFYATSPGCKHAGDAEHTGI
ncbi:MAG: gluconate 2-dehydrogenase subunit 3 family protein [Silvibacterium sp.]